MQRKQNPPFEKRELGVYIGINLPTIYLEIIMNEDLGKNILLETITDYDGYSNDTRLPDHLENANIVKKHYETNKI